MVSSPFNRRTPQTSHTSHKRISPKLQLRPPFHRDSLSRRIVDTTCAIDRQKRHVVHRPCRRLTSRATYPQFVGPTSPPHLEPSSPECELKTSLERAAILLLSRTGDTDRACSVSIISRRDNAAFIWSGRTCMQHAVQACHISKKVTQAVDDPRG